MAHTKSALKRARQSRVSRASNLDVRSRIKSQRTKFLAALAAKDAATADKHYRAFASLLDKAAKKGVLKRNNAIRKKGRAAAALRAIKAA
jgi:small subunit ribosomal protein S20